MPLPPLASRLFAVALLSLSTLHAASVESELQELISSVRQKLDTGVRSEEALAPDLARFDTLGAAHASEKTDAAAQVPFMKAMLYLQVLNDDAKGRLVLQKIQADFPGTETAKRVPEIIASLEEKSAARAIQAKLVPGTSFPPFTGTDLEGKPYALSGDQGKVVLVDFWATWCGPCVAELPGVLSAYQKYHGRGLEIVGISLDEDKPTLTTFVSEQKVPWRQLFDGKGWKGELARTYGVTAIPMNYLLDREGKIIAADLHGPELDQALAKAFPAPGAAEAPKAAQ